jgi:hypothetical protein
MDTDKHRFFPRILSVSICVYLWPIQKYLGETFNVSEGFESFNTVTALPFLHP